MDGSRIAVLCKVTEQLVLVPAFKQYWHGSVEGCMVLKHFYFFFPVRLQEKIGGRIQNICVYIYHYC